MKKLAMYFLFIVISSAGLTAMEVLVNGEDQFTITQGEDFIITVNFTTGFTQAETSLWVDMNGNGILEFDIDITIPGEDRTITDNGPYDENPAVGVYEMSVSGEEDGPNNVSNLGLYYYAEDNGGSDSAFLWIDSIVSDYSVSGSVLPAVPNIIIIAGNENGSWMTTTDATGHYQNFVEDIDNYMLMAFDPLNVLGGLLPINSYDNVLINDHLTGYDFEFIEGTSHINGHITDDNDDPVTDLRVEAHQDDLFGIITTTDETGYYEFNVIEGEWSIELSMEELYPDYMDRETVYVYVEEGATETVDIMLYTTDSTISGTVYFEDIPSAGYNVSANNYQIGMSETSSQLDGTYSLFVSSAADAYGGYNLNIDLWDIPGVYVEENYSNVLSGSTNINFHIYSSSGGIEGEVLDANSMEPVENSWISAYNDVSWFGCGVNEDGSYQLFLPNGTYQVEVNSEFYYQQTIENVVIADDMIQLDFQLVPIEFNGAVEGNIYETGTFDPVIDARVSVYTPDYYAETMTNDDGWYHIDLPNGSFSISTWHQNYYSFNAENLVINNDVVQYNIELDPVIFEGSLAGYAYELDSVIPVPYATIDVNSPDYWNQVQTDANGYYFVELPNGNYSTNCWKDGYIGQQINNIVIENNSVIQDFYLEAIVEADEEVSGLNDHLNQNYPNPFNPTTTISFTIKDLQKVELEIFNIKGQKIKTLINSIMERGDHLIQWDGTDKTGQPVSSGIYFYNLKTGDKVISTKRMLLIK